jgi:hypothetical protein
MYIITNNVDIFLEAKFIGLGVNVDKVKYRNHENKTCCKVVRVGNISMKNVSKFKYLQTTIYLLNL